LSGALSKVGLLTMQWQLSHIDALNQKRLG